MFRLMLEPCFEINDTIKVFLWATNFIYAHIIIFLCASCVQYPDLLLLKYIALKKLIFLLIFLQIGPHRGRKVHMYCYGTCKISGCVIVLITYYFQ